MIMCRFWFGFNCQETVVTSLGAFGAIEVSATSEFDMLVVTTQANLATRTMRIYATG